MTLSTLRKTLSGASLSLLFSISAVAQTLPVTREGDIAVGDGVQIHYVEGGDRNAKTTILFIPGWSMSTAVWRDQMFGFASTSHVISIDPRSQGYSTITTQSNSPEQRANDLRQVIQSLALTNIVLVGWSQGVQDVAAYAAAFQGDGVSGYVLVDAAVGAGAAFSVARPEELKQRLERFAIYQQSPKEYLQGMMNAIIRSPEGRKRIDEYVRIGLRTPPDLGITMLMMDFIAVDRRATLAKFNRPTLIIAASESDEVETQREMSRIIKDALFKTVDDAGHAVFLDQPKRFHDLLASFVRRTEQKTPAN
jgi:non-heme chloroperoxidase